MDPTDLDAFDPEEWAELARVDPEEFERCRRAAIEALIARAPAHLERRLRGLQWQIDCEREKAGSPLAACLRINNMMWDFFYADRGFVNAVNMRVEPLPAEEDHPASVTPLHPRP